MRVPAVTERLAGTRRAPGLKLFISEAVSV